MKSAPPTFLVAACWLAAMPVLGADLRPSWECLPAETAAMVRLPQPREFVATLKSRTKFGATLLGERRLERMGKVLLDMMRRDGSGEMLGGFDEALTRYGLERTDLAAVFDGDMGFGIVVKRRDDGLPPLQMMLAWLEPGAGSAQRIVAAGKQVIEERQAEGDAAPRRIDLEMAGHEVIWVREPVMRLDVGDIAVEAEGDAAGGDRVEALQERIRAAAVEQSGLAHSFLARIGGRLLFGRTGDASAPDAGGDDPDWDAVSGAEEAKETFLRFLAAHAAANAAPLADVLDMPGVRATLPEGLTFVDVVVDPRPLRAAFGDMETAEVAEFLENVGLGTVGPFAWRQTLDGGLFHQGMFLSMPAPRRGLMQVLDQPCDPSEPPPFASHEAVSLTQVSLDLGKAYQTVREVLVAAGGDEAGNMFMTAEAQAQGWLGLDLPRFLSAFGSRHWIVDYPPKIAAAVAAGREAGGVAERLREADEGAFVWQVTDDAPFRKVLQQLAPLAGGEVKDEQGFGVIRVPDGAAAAIGMNHLVVAIGEDSLARTLAGIRNPPAGAASLREGGAMQRAGKLLPLGPARMFAVGDATRTGGGLGSLREVAASMEPTDVPAEYRDLLAGLKDALPTAAEMEGMFGVSVSTMRMTDEGLVLRSAWEMPPP